MGEQLTSSEVFNSLIYSASGLYSAHHLGPIFYNYLLNIGPDHLGRLPAPAVEILRQVGENSR